MNKKTISDLRIAIVGATGLVGRTAIKVLTEEKIDAELILFNSTGGVQIEINGENHITHALNEATVKEVKIDYVLFCAEKELSEKFSPMFAKQGSIVIDNSSAFRRDPRVPLVVPECNFGEISNSHKIIANPNCTTIGAMVALKPLDDKYKLKRVVFSTYQAISGAGANPKFAHPIENNVITHIDGEEDKMQFETNKILRNNDPKNAIGVAATCVRVPVANCHTISINAEFHNAIDIDEIKKILSTAPRAILLPDDQLPMPIIANDRNEVFIGRIRKDESQPNTINLICTSDNIRKGAATNAVQILQRLIKGTHA